jgi:hypothetical protein
MKLTWLQSAGIVLLALLVLGWSEVYLPLAESMRVDVIELAGELRADRAEITRLRDDTPRLQALIERLGTEVARLGDQFASAFSDELYLAINTAANRLYLRRGRDVIHEAVISTGSSDTLKHGQRTWIFETPRGELTIWRKKEKPVWIKPDWAFFEEGKPVPESWDAPERRQKGVLGDFLLDLGGGVAIHGTPYENLLGQSVTHGCIRVGRDDLKVLFDSVPVGAKVYIY